MQLETLGVLYECRESLSVRTPLQVYGQRVVQANATLLACAQAPDLFYLGDNETLPSLDGSGRPWYVRVTDFASPEALATPFARTMTRPRHPVINKFCISMSRC